MYSYRPLLLPVGVDDLMKVLEHINTLDAVVTTAHTAQEVLKISLFPVYG